MKVFQNLLRNKVLFLCLTLLAPGIQAATHSYEVRMASASDTRFQAQGPASYATFVVAFRQFPWAEQVVKSDAFFEDSGEEAVAPAIKVKRGTAAGSPSFFVSAIGKPEALGYVVGVVYPREFLLEPEGNETETVRWAELFVVKPAALVERYAKKFFAGDIDTLLEFMRKAPPFASDEASLIPNLGE